MDLMTSRAPTTKPAIIPNKSINIFTVLKILPRRSSFPLAATQKLLIPSVFSNLASYPRYPIASFAPRINK
jgi:hypothetical protein